MRRNAAEGGGDFVGVGHPRGDGRRLLGPLKHLQPASCNSFQSHLVSVQMPYRDPVNSKWRDRARRNALAAGRDRNEAPVQPCRDVVSELEEIAYEK
jgi:hypothetical protein